MEDGFFDYLADGERAEAYCSSPKAGNPLGQVVVIHEVWGFNRFIQDACDRLAREGFRAVAPVLYWRDKALFSPKRIRKGMEVVWNLSLEDRYRPERLEAALKNGRASSETGSMLRLLYDKGFRSKLQRGVRSLADRLRNEDPKLPMGAVGFSMGGKLAMQLAAGFPGVKACVAYSAEPVLGDAVGKIRSPILLLYGSEDRFMMRDLPAFVGDAIDSGTELALKTYSSAGHEFFDQSNRTAYRAASAEDAWATTVDFLRKNLSVAAKQDVARGSRTKQKKFTGDRAQIRASNP